MAVAPYTGPVEEFPRNSLIEPLLTEDPPRAARVLVSDSQGEHLGWQLAESAAAEFGLNTPDRVMLAGLRTPSVALQAELDAVAAANTTQTNKLTAFRNLVKVQVARVKAIPQASRTDQDKWLLALSMLLLSEE